MDNTAPHTTRRIQLAAIARPAAAYVADLKQRLQRRLETRASTTRHRPAQRPRPHQPFTLPPSPPPAVWHIEATELTHALKDDWH